MFERLANDVREILGFAMEEARYRGDNRLGTDHLLLGALREPGPAGTMGVTVEVARAAARKLDRAALASVGIDAEGVKPDTMPRPGKHLPFSSGARSVLERMHRYATAEKARKITTAHLLLSLLDREEHDPAAALLNELAVDRTEVRRRILAG
ncbi:Clp protease N-terminal domain-containing protein [Pseudarthrobacter albicanus]|uniref:Clp protease N-terminal domain-containing protein n=1 Tax=Pseudarthrobacter albicanus TaxID=2823873 RepID=UPI001BA6E9A5|nr:Clp protease N-terminal domain-containing protein [Pseudarthrobacter albicanus]